MLTWTKYLLQQILRNVSKVLQWTAAAVLGMSSVYVSRNVEDTQFKKCDVRHDLHACQ
jgi:hypothetical protein